MVSNEPNGRQYSGPVPLKDGMNVYLDPVALEDSQLSGASDVILRGGVMEARSGLSQVTAFTSAYGAVNYPIWCAYPFVTDQGTRILLVSTGNYVLTYYASTWTNIFTWPTATTSNPTDVCSGVDESVTGMGGAVFFADGINELHYWNQLAGVPASTLVKVTASSDYVAGPVTLAPRYCCMFQGRLVLGHVTESGTAHVNRTRMSAVNNFFNFNTALGAQVVDHADSPGEITGVASDEASVYVLKSDSIIIGHDDGTGALMFPTQLKTGCVSGRTFKAISPYTKVFLGPDNVYALTGGTVEAIGDAIKRDLFATGDFSFPRYFHAGVDREKCLYRLWVPDVTDSDRLSVCYTYNWIDKGWTKEKFKQSISCMGAIDFTAGNTIGSLGLGGTGTLAYWGGFGTKIGDWGSFIATPQPMLGYQYNAASYRLGNITRDTAISNYDPSAPTATTVKAQIVSKDFRLNPNGYATLYGVNVTAQAPVTHVVTVSVSTDRGVSWAVTQSKTLATGATPKFMRFQFSQYGVLHRIKVDALPTRLAANFTSPLKLLDMELSWVRRNPLR